MTIKPDRSFSPAMNNEKIAVAPRSRLLRPIGHRAAAWMLTGLMASAALRAQTTVTVPADTDGLRPAHLISLDYAELTVADTEAVLTAPFSWNSGDWQTAGWSAAAIVGVGAFDHGIKTGAQKYRTPGDNRLARDYQQLGAVGSFVILGVFEAWGELGGDSKARAVGMDGLTSSLIASGLIAPALKYAIGRERPSQTSGTYSFRPFRGDQSFPSGHTTQAFVLATAIAENYPEPVVRAVSYGGAALVGVARIQQNAHFGSDVVAGAVLGWAVTRMVGHRHDTPAAKFALQVVPYFDGQEAGLRFTKNF